LQALEAIRRLGGTKYLGPSPTFSELHLLKTVYLLGERAALGRGLLARHLGLGHGAVRTVIERLRKSQLITVGRGGCKLTPRGQRTFEALRRVLSPLKSVDAGRLATGKHSTAVLVRGVAGKVRIGIEQRDAAIRAGATGAATIIYRRRRFEIPGSSGDAEGQFPDPVWRRLVDVFQPHDGDVIIVSSAASREVSENGALSAATTLL
jgi:hypothetical protein